MIDYKQALEIQKNNSQKNPNLTYLTWLYSQVSKNLKSNQNILEIGAGAGLSQNFLKNTEILKTDVLSWKSNSVLGNIDAANLPFKDNTFSGVFAVDVLHHTDSPYKVINECLRVLKQGQNFVIIEPYVSYFSYGVYKLFHHEDTTWNLDLKVMQNRNSQVFNGDQGVSRILFGTQRRVQISKKEIEYNLEVRVKYISILSFFATGGLSKPIKTPKFILSTLIRIEDMIPQFVMKRLASRILVVMTKQENVNK